MLRRWLLRLSWLGLCLGGACARSLHAQSAAPKPVLVPLSAHDGIGFDDLIFAPQARRVLAPGGKTGNLYAIDPATRQVTPIAGFSSIQGRPYRGGHEDGVTSADEAGDVLLAVDRTARSLSVVDAAHGKLVSSVALAGEPDYVRWIAATREAWVTEPGHEQIEIFSVAADAHHALVRTGAIAVPGGPESLVVDAAGGRAFTHLWRGSTRAIDVRQRTLGEPWPNGCQGSRGIALDSEHGFLFSGCAEGKATVLDVEHGGKLLGSLHTGDGVDVIAYSSKLRHLYVPAAKSATLSVLAVSRSGALTLLANWPSVALGHCAVADDRAQVWVCDPEHGLLLVFKDETHAGPARP